MNITRRELLQSLAVTGAGLLSAEGTSDVFAQSAVNKNYDLVAVMGGEPAAMFDAAIKQMGGIGRFVKPGQKVTIKPNIGWDKTPELAGNTNPDLISAIIKACQAAGAKEITVFDHTCDEWRRCYNTSGIKDAAEALGAVVMPANEERYYREIQLPRGKNMKSALVHQAILDSDVWINVPVLKTHSGARMTICMKNHMGIVWDRRFFHTHDLQQCIADICTIKNPAVLNIVDAYRVMKSNGPRGRSEADVVTPKALFMGTDIVAVDTMATRFFGQIVSMPLSDVSHLANGQALKVGTMNPAPASIKRIKM